MFPVIINWRKKADPHYSWNEACVWAMEQFGLPGEKTYLVAFDDDNLTFNFIKSQDAILMKLRWS